MTAEIVWTYEPAALHALLMSEDGELAREMKKIGQRVERDAKHYCPVDTGRLRASITNDVGRDAQGLYAVVGTDVEYSVFVELGTVKTRAQPYLVPAVIDEMNRSAGR